MQTNKIIEQTQSGIKKKHLMFAAIYLRSEMIEMNYAVFFLHTFIYYFEIMNKHVCT